MTTLVGPPRDLGIIERMRARVNAVATSPSSSTRSKEPVGKKGSTSVNEEMKSLGSAKMTEICSNMTAGELNEARNATCCPRMSWALLMNRFGKPSSKLLVVRRHRTRRIRLLHEIGEARRERGQEGGRVAYRQLMDWSSMASELAATLRASSSHSEQ